MPYSKYAMRTGRPMLNAILLAIAVVALAVGLVSERRGFSPWRLLLAACLASVPVVLVGQVEAGRPCDAASIDVVPDWLFLSSVVMSLALYGAAAVGAVAGVRRAWSGHEGAIARGVVCPFLSVLGVLLVFYSFLLAALHCD